MKKRGFGAGKYNGFGGKVEAGETILQAALREMEEESGAIVSDAVKCGELLFEFEDDPVLLEVHLFKATAFSGEIIERFVNSRPLPNSVVTRHQWRDAARVVWSQRYPVWPYVGWWYSLVSLYAGQQVLHRILLISRTRYNCWASYQRSRQIWMSLIKNEKPTPVLHRQVQNPKCSHNYAKN